MDKQVKECRSAPFVAPKILERCSALPLKICWSYGAALLVRERLPKSENNLTCHPVHMLSFVCDVLLKYVLVIISVGCVGL